MSDLQKYIELSFHTSEWQEMTLLEQANIHERAKRELAALTAQLAATRAVLAERDNEVVDLRLRVAKLDAGLKDLIDINERDEKGDPDYLATDAGREKAWSRAAALLKEQS